eukprot:scaffold144323_cov27-Tisochrysis_lutea.AAC.1
MGQQRSLDVSTKSWKSIFVGCALTASGRVSHAPSPGSTVAKSSSSRTHVLPAPGKVHRSGGRAAEPGLRNCRRPCRRSHCARCSAAAEAIGDADGRQFAAAGRLSKEDAGPAIRRLPPCSIVT